MKEKKIDGALVFDENFTSNLVLNKTADINIFLEGTDQAKSVLITKSVSNAYLTVAKNQQGNNGTSIEVNSQDVYGTDMDTEDMIMTSIIALITLILTSIISTVTMVNLRRKKTFKSMINSPIKATLACTIGNYLFSIITALIVFFYALYILNITMEGSVINSLLLTLFIALIGTSIGVFVTAITRKDSQAFGLLIPIIILQYLFGGNIVAVSKFDIYVQYFSYLLPMTYSLDAMKSLVIRNYSWGDVWIDLVALLIILILLFTFSVVGLKYQSRSQQTNE
jgi:ABC-2 type transport system permease protein